MTLTHLLHILQLKIQKKPFICRVLKHYFQADLICIKKSYKCSDKIFVLNRNTNLFASQNNIMVKSHKWSWNDICNFNILTQTKDSSPHLFLVNQIRALKFINSRLAIGSLSELCSNPFEYIRYLHLCTDFLIKFDTLIV